MIVIISCAKRQRTPSGLIMPTAMPLFQDIAQKSILTLSHYDKNALAELLHISPTLGELNAERYYNAVHNIAEITCALDTFDGDVYEAMDRKTWSQEAWQHAQKHLRIISGLYGYLRPLDGIVAHRLEMATRLPWLTHSLATFWQPHIAHAITQESTHNYIINLASIDYAKAVPHTIPNIKWIDVDFLDRKKDGSYGTIGVRAKKARGHMVQAICNNAWSSPHDLKNFNNGYAYHEEYSTPKRLVFITQ